MVDPDIRWYAVYTHLQSEAQADCELRRLGYMTFFPFHRVRLRRKRPGRHAYRVEWVDRPYFPRYTFVAVRQIMGTWESIGPAMRAKGVFGVVQSNGEPLEIPIRVMDELMARADEAGLIGEQDLLARNRLKAGQRVSIEGNTPLSGLLAQVSLDTGKEIRLWVEMLGAKRLVRANPEHVTAI